MPSREEMQSLAQDIVRSYEDRISGIADLREIVKVGLKEFQDSRAAMSKDLRGDLAKSVAARKAAVSSQLKELDAAHQAMGRQQRADLVKGRSDLASNVASELKELDAAHQAMGRQQRADLAKGRSDLASNVASELKELDAAHQGMGRQQRADLTKAEGQRKSEVNAWMKDVTTAHAEARDEWQKLTASMQSKRGGVAVAVKPSAATPPAGEALISPQLAAVVGRVFAYLADHPDGTRMTELEQEFGLARIQMARAIRSLIDENKVEKRGLLYFAI